MSTLNPFLRSPFTDLTGSMVNHQFNGKCAEMEMNMMDCLEAYGADRGKTICKDLIDDFHECFMYTKQMKRLQAMYDERMRQYRAGERSKEELFAKPPLNDAY